MKVLLVNITGRSGSTGKIVSDIRDSLIKEGHDAIVAYGHADKVSEAGYYQISKRMEGAFSLRLSRLGRCSYKGNPFAFPRLKKVIEKERPDIVHLHCINCHSVNIYKTLKYLASRRIKTVVTHHAEFFYTGSCPYSYSCFLYTSSQCEGCPTPQAATSNPILPNPKKNWIRMYNAFNTFSTENLVFTSVSPWVHERALMSPIVNKYQDFVVLNGLNTNVFKCSTGDKEVITKFPDVTKYVLHVTPFFDPLDPNDIKGGYYVVEAARRLPHFHFVVVASVTTNCKELPSNIHMWGRTEDQEQLSRLYSGAQLTLLASKRETFSMVTAESLCCGTPVVGFKAGGPESIAIDEYCEFIEYGNMQTLCESITKCYGTTHNKEYISEIARNKYSREKMSTDYLTVYKHLLNKKIL